MAPVFAPGLRSPLAKRLVLVTGDGTEVTICRFYETTQKANARGVGIALARERTSILIRYIHIYNTRICDIYINLTIIIY